MHFFAYLLTVGFVAQASAKVYERCELARELVNVHGFQRPTLGNWVCLMYYESSYRTDATNTNTNGSKDYGILQINDGFWCDPPYNDCNISCQSLLNTDLRDDMNCARIIFNRHGFSAWYGWQRGCEGTDVESWVNDCF